ncbi:MAG: hypothetical protein V7776_22015 [Halopseudomonas aestusnigri]
MSLMRRYNKAFIVAVAFSIGLEVSSYVVVQNELAYINDTIKSVSEQYRNLSRLTKSLLRGERGQPLQKDAWIQAWKDFDDGVSELRSHRYQLLLTEGIKERRNTIFLFWDSSQKGFISAVEKIDQVFPDHSKIPSSAGIFPLLDKAKHKGDRPSIILLSELVSSLISFNVFAKEIMQVELLLLDKDINERSERINYYYWLQLSIVLFVFFIGAIVLLFVRDDPLSKRRKRLRKAKITMKTKAKRKRQAPRVLNKEQH